MVFEIENNVLKKYNGNDTEVVIPDGVTSIGGSAFRGCTSLTNITIPDGVTSIGWYAFDGCTSLKSITIPDSVTSIEACAFSGCTSLKSITIPDGVTSISVSAFYGCKSLKSITIPEGVTSIGQRTFYGCKSLKSITIPEGVTSIGQRTFDGCNSLASITLPDGVTNIAGSIFKDCTSLTNITIPDGVVSIGGYAFSGCESLTSITIPDSVTDIAGSAFRDCKSLTSVTIPDSVTSIGDYAFYGCTSLTSITIPDSVTRIDSSAFSGCTSLTEIQVPEGNEAYTSCDGVLFSKDKTTLVCYPSGKAGKSYVIPDGVTTIGWDAFLGCTSLTSITIPDGVTSIGESAFSSCTSLTSITIPEGVTSIGDSAFWECTSLTSITIPEGVTSIDGRVFSGCTSLTSITIPDGVPSIGELAFSGCTSLINITIPNSVTSIGENTFSGCTRLAPITLPLHKISLAQEALDGVPLDRQSLCALCLFNTSKYAKTVLNRSLPEDIDDIAAYMLSVLESEGKNAQCAAFADFLIDHVAEISTERVVQARDLFRRKKAKKALIEIESLAEELGIDTAEDGTAPANKKLASHMDERFTEVYKNYSQIILDKFLKDNKLTLSDRLRKVHLKDSDETAPEFLIKCAVVPYLMQYTQPEFISAYKSACIEVHPDHDADQAAAFLNPEELSCGLRESREKASESSIKKWLIAEGRYATPANASALISMCSTWKKWNIYAANGRMNIIVARSGLLLNDSREAMMYLDKCGQLEKYAAIRNTDADVLRDRVMFDLGLDENGCKVYDLGNKTITLSLTSELTIELFDNVASRAVKSIPKKNADLKKYEAASADLKDIRKNHKKLIKMEIDRLFRQFLSGEKRKKNSWVMVYTGNPLLRAVARLIVWMQGSQTFTLDECGKPVCADGTPYSLNNMPVRVAHPFDMEEKDISAWQEYFRSRQLKQPFEQIWEPKYDLTAISEDRYCGVELSVFRFMNMEKHGISFEDYDFHNEIGICLDGCTVEYTRVKPYRHEIGKDETFRLGKFHVIKHSRRVNHIIYLLDKWSASQRIMQDDTGVLEIVDHFTPAQIQDLIDMAIENSAVNCTAALLELKNRKFPDYYNIDEFFLLEL